MLNMYALPYGLMYGRNQHNIVKQLSSNKIKKKKEFLKIVDNYNNLHQRGAVKSYYIKTLEHIESCLTQSKHCMDACYFTVNNITQLYFC